MLTREENDLLCQVGPGTPMGNVFRRYWFIAGLTKDVPEPDCPPVRVRLLGEDLLLFRDTNGRVGLVEEKCAHRRASLFYARNEECGLTCVYHGWKYDVDGNILDTPAEPERSLLKHTVKLGAYPTYEKNGIIMTYMGPKEKQPLVPNYEWLTLPSDQVLVEDKMYNHNNWLQGVEGDNDSAHVQYLHRNNGLAMAPGMSRALEFEVEDGPFWVKTAAIRHTAPGENYVRTNFFMMPCIGGPPQPAVNGISDGFQAVQQVPADDEHTWRFDIWTKRSGPYTDRVPFSSARGWPGLEEIPPVSPDGHKFANRGNDYLIDRQRQRQDVYAGIPFGAHTQDAAMTETMGAISDRWNEHLGMSDAGPVAIRRLLLRVVRAVMEGQDPPGLAYREEDNNCNLDLVHATLPPGVSWRDVKAVQEGMLASGGQLRL